MTFWPRCAPACWRSRAADRGCMLQYQHTLTADIVRRLMDLIRLVRAVLIVVFLVGVGAWALIGRAVGLGYVGGGFVGIILGLLLQFFASLATIGIDGWRRCWWRRGHPALQALGPKPEDATQGTHGRAHRPQSCVAAPPPGRRCAGVAGGGDDGHRRSDARHRCGRAHRSGGGLSGAAPSAASWRSQAYIRCRHYSHIQRFARPTMGRLAQASTSVRRSGLSPCASLPNTSATPPGQMLSSHGRPR